MPASILFGATDMTSTYGLQLVDIPKGWFGAVPSTRDASTSLFRPGGGISRISVTGTRAHELDVFLRATTAAARELAEQAVAAYQDQLVTLRISDGTTARESVAWCTSVALTPKGYVNSPVSVGKLGFLANDPFLRATSDTAPTFTTSFVTLSLGNAPLADWVLTIPGPFTNVTVTIANAAGTTLFTLVYTGSIASGHTLTINGGTGAVTDNGTNVYGNWSGGFPVIDPAVAPKLKLATSSGTPTGTLTYRKKYR